MQRSTQRHGPSAALCDCGGDTQVRHGGFFLFYFFVLATETSNLLDKRRKLFSVSAENPIREAPRADGSIPQAEKIPPPLTKKKKKKGSHELEPVETEGQKVATPSPKQSMGYS